MFLISQSSFPQTIYITTLFLIHSLWASYWLNRSQHTHYFAFSGIILGVAIGLAIAILLLILIVLYCCERYRHSKRFRKLLRRFGGPTAEDDPFDDLDYTKKDGWGDRLGKCRAAVSVVSILFIVPDSVQTETLKLNFWLHQGCNMMVTTFRMKFSFWANTWQHIVQGHKLSSPALMSRWSSGRGWNKDVVLTVITGPPRY